MVSLFGKLTRHDTSNSGDDQKADHVEPEAEVDISIALIIINSGYCVTYELICFSSSHAFGFAGEIPLNSFSLPEAIRSVFLCHMVDVVGTERETHQVVINARVELDI